MNYGRSAKNVAHNLYIAGVGAGDYVPVYGRKSVETIAAFVGVMRSVAAFVPIRAGIPQGRLPEILSASAGPIVLTSEDLASDVGLYRSRILPIKRD
jgi:non-ribosomal peptide synthetase component F